MLLTKSNADRFGEWFEFVSETGGFCLIDKESGWTSFDVVAKLRGITHIKKIGHAGTLDPLATGLLIIAFGGFTKKIEELTNLDKTYTGTIKLGSTTKTYDSEGEEENITDTSLITITEIENARNAFTGEIEQMPPPYSAKKVKGKALYKYARKNQQVEIKPSIVNVSVFDIINFKNPLIDFKIKCSKGTYIRSIAHDLGQKLGTGAYLYSLRRTSSGSFDVDHAFTIKEFNELFVSYRILKQQENTDENL